MYYLFRLITLFSVLSAPAMADPVFSPYVDLTLNVHWDSKIGDLAPADLVTPALTNGIKSLHLAFITDAGRCQPAWGGQAAYSLAGRWGKNEIDSLAKNGIRTVVSFGGASNQDISQNCDANRLVEIFRQVMTDYHAETLDFDIENGTANIPVLMQALQLLQQQTDVKLSFTLPVMPEGLVWQGKEVLKAAREKGLSFNVNIMAMDYGPAYTGDMGEYAIQAATNLQRFLAEIYPDKTADALWQLIEVTPMIGVNDVSVEQFTLANADRLKQFAVQNKLAGLSIWSLTRDKPCADKWASPLCSGNGLQTRDYEFSRHFQK